MEPEHSSSNEAMSSICALCCSLDSVVICRLLKSMASHAEQIGVGAGVDKVKDFESLLNAVDKKPIWPYVALTAFFVPPSELMVAEFVGQFVALGQCAHHVIQFVHRQSTFLRQLV